MMMMVHCAWAHKLLSNSSSQTMKSSLGSFSDLCFSALVKNDHPKLCNTPLCSPHNVTKFQSLLGASQWMISLVYFNLAKPTMSLSHFHHCPHVSHLDSLKHLCGYIANFLTGPFTSIPASLLMKNIVALNQLTMTGWTPFMAWFLKKSPPPPHAFPTW